MNILLTGHKGFIGQNLLLGLKQYNVVGYEWGSILPSLKDFDWIIHLGAISSTTEKNIEQLKLQNVDFSIDLYENCVYNNVNMQFASSASVYGLTSSFDENSICDPKTPYATSKYAFEQYVQKHPPKNSLIQIFRYFNVYGPFEDHKKNQASPYHSFIQQAKEQKKIKLFKNSENYLRDFVHVDKIVDWHRKFFEVKESGIWNFGTGIATSFYTIAKEIQNKYNCDIEYIDMPNELLNNYQTFTRANVEKLNRTLHE